PRDGEVDGTKYHLGFCSHPVENKRLYRADYRWCERKDGAGGRPRYHVRYAPARFRNLRQCFHSDGHPRTQPADRQRRNPRNRHDDRVAAGKIQALHRPLFRLYIDADGRVAVLQKGPRRYRAESGDRYRLEFYLPGIGPVFDDVLPQRRITTLDSHLDPEHLVFDPGPLA